MGLFIGYKNKGLYRNSPFEMKRFKIYWAKLDHITQLEDRQVHGDNETADKNTQNNHN